VVLLEEMPVFLRVHLLDFLAEASVVIFQDLESLEKPLKFAQHVVALLLPKSSSYLVLVVLFPLLLGVHVELAVVVVADGHLGSSPLAQELRVGVNGLLHV